MQIKLPRYKTTTNLAHSDYGIWAALPNSQVLKKSHVAKSLTVNVCHLYESTISKYPCNIFCYILSVI